MDNKIDFKIILDFSKGKYSYNDYLNVKHWFNNVRDDAEINERLFNQWKELSGGSNTKSLHPIFEKIQYQILLEEKKNGQKKNIWHVYRQIAAVLFPILIMSSLFYLFTQPKQIDTRSWIDINVPEGARVGFLLPDSTSGWLNSGARLKYPAQFSKQRKVELIGEAFFNVRSMKGSDFTVGVHDMNIKVHGTKFNVSAYDNDAVTEVVLEEGCVEVEGKASRFNQFLLPGEKISYNHEKNTLNRMTVDPNIYTAWTQGSLIIDNESFALAAKKLERWYNVDISIQDEALKNFRFRATFNEEPLEEVLRYIAMTTPISYKIENRDQNSYGVLKKKQVIIKLKR